MKIRKHRLFIILLGLSISMFYTKVQSQDLEPRILSSLPTGTNVLLMSYGYSRGDILLDQSAPIEDLDAKLNNIVGGYVRSFSLFKKLTKFDVIVPYSFAEFNALVTERDTIVTRNGFGDPLFRISMILIGSPALNPKEYMQHEQKKFKLGAFFRFKAPLGHYDSSKLINLGSNRWSFKTGIAGSYTFNKKLVFEAHFNSWFYTENKDFFGGNTSSQDPVYGVQLHSGYIFKPGLWVAGSIGRTFGGQTSINGVEQDTKLENGRFGLTFAYRVAKQHSLKAVYTNGFVTRSGSDFNTLLLAYQYIWMKKPKPVK